MFRMVVTRVASARAALGALAYNRRINLIFSDIMMPGNVDGLDLAREIQKRRPDLPDRSDERPCHRT
jgi:CheY-like chemotaxis protein